MAGCPMLEAYPVLYCNPVSTLLSTPFSGWSHERYLLIPCPEGLLQENITLRIEDDCTQAIDIVGK